MKKILVVEDDLNLGTLLSDYLDAKGYKTTLVKDGDEGYRTFTANTFDICILDVMMPKKDGFTLAKEIRDINQQVPIIFLTARSQKDDRIEGLKTGADDYVTKPFSMEELLLRIKAILKRTAPEEIEKEEEQTIFEIGTLKFNHLLQIVYDGKEEQKLTSKENDLLRLLCLHKNQVLDRTLALKTIWGDDSYYNSRSMDVYVTKLRKYLKSDENIQILNVHGKGFKLLA